MSQGRANRTQTLMRLSREAGRRQIFARDNWTCARCGFRFGVGVVQKQGRRLTLDHVIPLSKGGTHDSDNMQAMCDECNCRKADQLQAVAP